MGQRRGVEDFIFAGKRDGGTLTDIVIYGVGGTRTWRRWFRFINAAEVKGVKKKKRKQKPESSFPPWSEQAAWRKALLSFDIEIILRSLSLIFTARQSQTTDT